MGLSQELLRKKKKKQDEMRCYFQEFSKPAFSTKTLGTCKKKVWYPWQKGITYNILYLIKVPEVSHHTWIWSLVGVSH